MPYSPIQDGLQKFGVTYGPITLNGITYIMEDWSDTMGSDIVGINAQNGAPSGQVIFPNNPTGSARLQIATTATPAPPWGTLFTAKGAQWYITEVGEAQQMRGYAYYSVNFTMKIAA